MIILCTRDQFSFAFEQKSQREMLSFFVITVDILAKYDYSQYGTKIIAKKGFS